MGKVCFFSTFLKNWALAVARGLVLWRASFFRLLCFLFADGRVLRNSAPRHHFELGFVFPAEKSASAPGGRRQARLAWMCGRSAGFAIRSWGVSYPRKKATLPMSRAKRSILGCGPGDPVLNQIYLGCLWGPFPPSPLPSGAPEIEKVRS